MRQNETKMTSEKYTPRQKKVRTRVMIGRIIFTVFLLAYVGVLLHFAKYGYGLLMDWLVRLEASQPDVRSEEVFNELFSDPDWEALYEMAGEEDTLYEGAQAYATYMENLVGDNELTYVETSAGLSGNKKFIVKSNDTKVAEFTLKNMAPEGEEIPEWTLDEVFVFYTRQESLTIFTVPGHTVYINGVAIDTEEHMIATTSTVVEEYLPDDLHGYQDITLRFEGLLVQPEVTILDETGMPMEVVCDPTVNLYAEQLAPPEAIPEDLESMVIGAAQSFGRYMINARDHQLSTYFDKNAKAYQDIILFERWTMQTYQSYAFEDISVSGYYRYSDTYFSARVSMVLNVTYNSMFTGEISVKPYYLDTTFFVRQNEEGTWLVETMTNVDVQEVIHSVKLVYMQGNKLVDTQWVEADAEKITLPEIATPNGEEFLGWYTKTVNGLDVNYSLVFRPSENGVIVLPEGYTLEPMVLYAQFQ